MAIYTHFGSMGSLRRAVRREGLTALSARLAAARTTGDRVANLVALARAYQLYATTHPHLFQAIFMDRPLDDAELKEGRDILELFVRGIDACMRAGRLDPADPTCLAIQLWSAVHGTVTLQLAGTLTNEEALDCLTCSTNRMILQLPPPSPARLSHPASCRSSDGGAMSAPPASTHGPCARRKRGRRTRMPAARCRRSGAARGAHDIGFDRIQYTSAQLSPPSWRGSCSLLSPGVRRTRRSP